MRLCLFEWCSSLGTLPPPTGCPWGMWPEPAAGFLWAQDAGVGVRWPTRGARSCELTLCAVGAAGDWQGGLGGLCIYEGNLGLDAFLPGLPVPGACGQGPLLFFFGKGGCW